MPAWIPMFALPNIEVQEPIEIDGLVLASTSDERIQSLAEQHASFANYLGSFRTEFGRSLQPSIMIRRDDTSELYRSVEALAGFRDAIALSVLPYSWADVLIHGQFAEVLYSDWFTIYPWMLDKNFEYVVMNSMAQLGLDEANELKPQSNPGITPRALVRRMVDRPMLAALLDRWPNRYAKESPSWSDTALFRSLNMANAAAKLPANAEGTLYDARRSLALWVSAFEILVHSGESGLFKVYDNFEKLEWRSACCAKKEYETHGHKKGQPLRNLACWLYGAIHKCRNDFLHGNPVTAETLVVPGSKRPLPPYAPILYRMALAGFLNLKWDEPEPIQAEELDTYYSQKFDFQYFQGEMEKALSTVLTPKIPSVTATRSARAVDQSLSSQP